MPIPPNRFISAPGALPQQSVSGAVNAALAPAKVGDAIQGLGQRGFELLERARKFDEAGTRSSFMANLDEQAGKFSNELLSRTDYKNWPTEWKNLLADFKQQATSQDLSPEGMAVLNEQLSRWGSERSISFEKLAATRQVSEGKARIGNSLQYYASRNDSEGMVRTIGEMHDAGFDQSEIDKAGMETARVATRSSIESSIKADPRVALEDIRSADFLDRNYGATAQDQQRYEAQARDQIEQLRSSEGELLTTKAKQGNLTNTDIDTANYLTEKDKVGLRAAMSASSPVSAETQAEAWLRLDALRMAREDPSITRESYRALHNEVRAEINQLIPPNSSSPARQDIDKEFNYLSPAGDGQRSRTDGTNSTSDLEALSRSAAARARDAGALGDLNTPQGKEQAYRRAEDVTLQTKKWIKGQKIIPTPEQVREYTDNLISGGRVTNIAVPTMRSLLTPSQRSFNRVYEQRSGAAFGDTSPMVLPPKDPEQRALDILNADGDILSDPAQATPEQIQQYLENK